MSDGKMLRTFLAATCVAYLTADIQAGSPGADFFEKSVRPILVEKCQACHGAQKQESGLRLDSREAALQGGVRGAAWLSDQPERSLLIQAVRRSGDLQMPPDEPLTAIESSAIEEWIRHGAIWPEDAKIDKRDSKSLWSLRPVQALPPPRDLLARSAIDAFIREKLSQVGLAPSPPASRRELIRRATFDLTGLPATFEEVEAFERDASPNAYERLVDRLLASPRYGERWARVWLDIARYADNKGYVFFENKDFFWSYTYRDYVIEALNRDKPYDRFVTEQLAADLLDPPVNGKTLAALGFLTLGSHFMNNVHDIVDDRIDVVSRGLLGLTTTCARCHDHKFDPITQEDYYALYGVFRSCEEPLLSPLFDAPADTEDYYAFEAEMDKRARDLSDFVSKKHTELLEDGRKRVDEYLLAAAALRGKPTTDETMVLISPGELNPTIIFRWRRRLADFGATHPVLVPWQRMLSISAEKWSTEVADAIHELQKLAAEGRANPIVVNAIVESKPQSLDEAARALGSLFREIDAEWISVKQSSDPNPNQKLADPLREEVRQELYGPSAAPNVPVAMDWSFLSLLPDRQSQEVYQKLIKAIEEWATTGRGAPARVVSIQDTKQPYEPFVFLRGNPNRAGKPVPRRFLQALGGVDSPFEKRGSGRLELAQAIVSAENPLTARVIVNRIWAQRFGQPIVATTSDFGTRSDPPSHPELLDFLAKELVRNNWSLKWLHREMMLSGAYQQSSEGSELGSKLDPENRLLWRMNRKRLEFEPLRDATLFVADQLDATIGGPADSMFGDSLIRRRSIYGYIDRLEVAPLLTTFDVPNPASTSPGRSLTTTPPQSLFFMNNPQIEQLATSVVARCDGMATIRDRIQAVFRIVLSREPDGAELKESMEYVLAGEQNAELVRLAQALLMSNEFAFVD